MELNYKILWFEDTDESFDSLSRQTKKYVEKKSLYCIIDRITGLSDLNMSTYDINSYDLLVVDLKLSNGSKGHDVIIKIRNSGFVNDILFYSSSGLPNLKAALSEFKLEGVFLSEREAALFMSNIKKLIDKSVKRSENVINIRGIVMDETSGFDNLMSEIMLKLINLLSVNEKQAVKEYIRSSLLCEQKESIEKLLDDYKEEIEWDYSRLFNNFSFSSSMKARLLNKIINLNNNDKITEIVSSCKSIFPELYNNKKIVFADRYINGVLSFRNKLAHVKSFNAENPALICEKDGVQYRCDEEFCKMIREILIKYGKWLNSLSELVNVSD